jgi:hypothetical protein
MVQVLMRTSTGAVASFIALASDAEVSKHIVCLVAENPFCSIPAITWDTVKNLVFKDLVCKNRTGNTNSQKVPYKCPIW